MLGVQFSSNFPRLISLCACSTGCSRLINFCAFSCVFRSLGSRILYFEELFGVLIDLSSEEHIDHLRQQNFRLLN